MSETEAGDRRIEARGERVVADASGVRLHGLAYGAGTPVVVLPGITSPAITWEFVAERLASRHRILVLDLRGRGESDVPDSGFGMLDYARDLRYFLDAVGLDRPALLGHSMGARAVLAFAARHPQRRGPVIAVDPPLTGPGRPPYPFPLEVYTDAIRKARSGLTVEDVRAVYPTWSERELEIRADWLGTCDEQAVVESYQRFHDEDVFDPWSRCAPPLLLLHGLDSPVVPPSGVAELRAANPEAETVGIAGAGHMVPWEQLDAFVDAVLEFLARVA